jgi:hypothetical protein
MYKKMNIGIEQRILRAVLILANTVLAWPKGQTAEFDNGDESILYLR